jgi:ADP-ribose pyrophosphatase
MASNSKWKVLTSQELMKSGFFKLRCDSLQLPDGQVQPRYYTMEFSDWVNVVAVTTNNEIILIRQYRPPKEDYFIEIPGGTTHPGQNEDPKEAARRELEEETGFVAKEIHLVGTHDPNPAMQTNKMWTYLALGCEKIKEQNLDPFEQVEVELVSIAKAYEMAHKGDIKHSLVLTALFLAKPHLKLHFLSDLDEDAFDRF